MATSSGKARILHDQETRIAIVWRPPVPSIIPILGLMMRKKTKVFGPRSALYTLRVTRAQIHEPFTTVLARPDDEALRICVETLRSLAREGRLNT